MNFNSLSLEKKFQHDAEYMLYFDARNVLTKDLLAKDQRHGMYIMQLVSALSLPRGRRMPTGPLKGERPACTCKFGTSTRRRLESINHALHVVVFVVGIAGRAGSILSNSVPPSRMVRTALFDKGWLHSNDFSLLAIRCYYSPRPISPFISNPFPIELCTNGIYRKSFCVI